MVASRCIFGSVSDMPPPYTFASITSVFDIFSFSSVTDSHPFIIAVACSGVAFPGIVMSMPMLSIDMKLSCPLPSHW